MNLGGVVRLELVVKNKYGYYELIDKPNLQEIESYYKNEYYQIPKGSYQKKYSVEEIEYINNKLRQKYIIANSILNPEAINKKFLDIGCGEGWSLKFYSNLGWEVTGLDYSLYGCKQFNNQQQDNIIEGDIYLNIEDLIEQGKKFNCIYLLNVLEHVIEPLNLLENCYKLLSDNGVIVIQVPNDYSAVQRNLLSCGFIDQEFWISMPDHISYFNVDGLINIGREAGLNNKKIICDFPIDLNLYNPETNYIKKPAEGNKCHLSRVKIENLLSEISDYKANKLYEILADIGIGRNIIAFFTK